MAVAAVVLLGAGSAARAEEPSYAAGQVVVTATRTPQPEGGVAGNLVVITHEQIQAAGARDLRTVLALAPGATVNDAGSPSGVATVSLRGSTSQQVLVLLDGRRLANAQSSWFSLNDLPVPVERIERIEVLPTPASALYGADALGGVVNIITRPVAPRPELALTQGFGSHDERRTSGGVQAGLGGVGVRVDGQLWTGDGARENEDFDARVVSAGIRSAPGPWTFGLGWDYLHRKEGTPGPEAFPSPDARQRDTKSYMRADLRHAGGGRWDLAAGLFWDEQRLRYENAALKEDSNHKNTSRGLDLQYGFDTGAGELFTLGGEWVRDGIESTNDGDHEADRWAVFAQDQWRAGAWSAVGALRYDRHEVYEGQTSPSLTVLYAPPGARLWAAVARGYRAPNFDDLYWRDAFTKGNPDLKPESSWSYEAGAEKRWGTTAMVRADIFRRNVKNLIRWADLDGDFVFSPENIASARIWGWELGLEYRPLPALALPASLQVLDQEDRDTGTHIPGAVKRLARVGLEYFGAGLTWSLDGTYTARYDTRRMEDWDYFILGAGAAWNGKVGRVPLHVSVRADNLQDRDFQTVEGFPMPGRTLYAEIGFRM